MAKVMLPTAVVMNMFHTGLGIARSLGEHGIPVVGLTSKRRVFGNFTRYAKIVFSPDSRTEPEALLAFLIRFSQKIGHRCVIFPTRDDDVLFLDRFRRELEEHCILTVPEGPILDACLDKWQTHLSAQRAGIASPRSWLIESEQHLRGILTELSYPCVLKPVSAHHWRGARNWDIVGGRKAIEIRSEEELLSEYSGVSCADTRALVQEMVLGGDEHLVITACYFDRHSNWVAGFNAQKLLQEPEGFGTGCIVQSVHRPELFEPTIRLLQSIRFTGIAEVEYKWDAAVEQYKLIEINPRAWDQHRLGKACGADLVLLAYREHAQLEMPVVKQPFPGQKWLAEDSFVTTALKLIWRRDPRLRVLFRMARGRRIYAIWSVRDPIPFFAHFLLIGIPQILSAIGRVVWASLVRRVRGGDVGVEMKYGL
jgi:D-aspartate ligase